MKALISLLLLLPTCVGLVIGCLVGPFVFGFKAGIDLVEDHIHGASRRAQAKAWKHTVKRAAE